MIKVSKIIEYLAMNVIIKMIKIMIKGTWTLQYEERLKTGTLKEGVVL